MKQVVPKWAVVATVDEPAPLLAAFVAHHLAQGASEVHLYLDRANPEAEALLSGVARCHLTVCDADYWRRSERGARPERHTGRQKHNATAAYRTTGADWLLHCDADEFVRDGAALVEDLALADADLGYLRLPNLERVHLAGAVRSHLFTGVFRAPIEEFEAVGPGLYGDFAPFLNRGLTGHRAGKGIVRVGRPYEMDVHFPRTLAEPDKQKVPYRNAEALLLHFDGLTRLHLALKLLRRAYEPTYKHPRPHGAFRIAQFGYVRDHADQPAAIAELAAGLQEIDARQVAALRDLFALDETPFDPRGAVAALLGPVDLGEAAFDEDLRHREAVLIEKSGLAL